MDQCALDVPAQEHILEILEQQPAICSTCTAAGEGH